MVEADAVYEAFKTAGADDDKARRAAELILGYEYRLRAIEVRLNSMTAQVIDLTEKVDAFGHQLKLLTWLIWIVGFLAGANLAIAAVRGLNSHLRDYDEQQQQHTQEFQRAPSMSMITNESEMRDLLEEYDRARRDEECPIDRRRRERAAERDEEQSQHLCETEARRLERRMR